MDSEDSKQLRFDAVDRAVAILAVLGSATSPLPLSKIAREVALGQPTTSRYLASLAGHGYVEKDENNRYRLGIRLYLLGQKALNDRDLRLIARPHIEMLHSKYNETVSLALRVNSELVVIDCIEATQALKQAATVGVQNPWHASSLGKAILAWLNADEVEQLLQSAALDRFTPKTLITRQSIEDEFSEIRELGFAMDNEESSLGGRCIGAPVFDSVGTPIGAISISGPISRIQTHIIAKVGKDVAEAANQISKSLGYQG